MSQTSPPYKAFHRTVARCADGTEVACGWLTLDTKHDWNLAHSAAEAADHYDHTGTLAAKVRASNGVHGVWVSGAARPGLSDREAWILQGPEASGDWRPFVDPDSGQRFGLELTAALAVPDPAFPGTRTRPELLVASNGAVVAQVGNLDPCDCDDEGEPMTPEDNARLAVLEEKVDALIASTAEPVDEAEMDALLASIEGVELIDTSVPLSAAEFARYVGRYDAERRKELAQAGQAMPDGTYPCADQGDVENAVRSLTHSVVAGNAAAIRRMIMRNAALLECSTGIIPATWQADGTLAG